MVNTLIHIKDNICKTLYSQGYDKFESQTVMMRILESVLGLNMTQLLLLDKDTILTQREENKIECIMRDLCSGRPLQYILGKADFYKHSILVDSNVLIPRPETEELCDLIIKTFSVYRHPLRLLDIGTGSGCIAYTLAYELTSDDTIIAIDISENALSVAKSNFALLPNDKARVSALKDDVFNTSIPKIPFDIIVSNPPYIMPKEADDMKTQVKDYEPNIALFAPIEEPTAYYRAIGLMVKNGYLLEDGSLWLEINPLLCDDTIKTLADSANIDSSEIVKIKDLSGKNRFLHYKKK